MHDPGAHTLITDHDHALDDYDTDHVGTTGEEEA